MQSVKYYMSFEDLYIVIVIFSPVKPDIQSDTCSAITRNKRWTTDTN